MIAKRWKRKGLFGALFVLAVLLFFGCDQNNTTFEWGGRTSSGLVSIVNDSLALLVNVRGYSICETTAMDGDMCEDGGDHTGLFLVNYRSKQAPLWGDTLDYYLGSYGDYYSDSSVMFLDEDDRFCFWKIGQKPTERKSWTWTGTCSPKLQGTKRARPWKDGNVLILGERIPQGGDSCQYAVLDTSTGIVSQGQFSGDDAWLGGCDDISYLDGKVACLQPIFADDRYGVRLLVDGLERDSLAWAISRWDIKTTVTGWYSTVFWINHPVYLFDETLNPLSGVMLYKLDVSDWKLDTLDSRVWINGASEFIQEDSTIVDYYDSEDLTVTGGVE
ncbi:MAG: hypothetical protein WCS54_05160 [Fibrobacteraceae bacterium]